MHDGRRSWNHQMVQMAVPARKGEEKEIHPVPGFQDLISPSAFAAKRGLMEEGKNQTPSPRVSSRGSTAIPEPDRQPSDARNLVRFVPTGLGCCDSLFDQCTPATLERRVRRSASVTVLCLPPSKVPSHRGLLRGMVDKIQRPVKSYSAGHPSQPRLPGEKCG